MARRAFFQAKHSEMVPWPFDRERTESGSGRVRSVGAGRRAELPGFQGAQGRDHTGREAGLNVADNGLRSPSLVREDAIVGREIRAVASARGADEALAVDDRDVALVQSSGDIEDGVVGP